MPALPRPSLLGLALLCAAPAALAADGGGAPRVAVDIAPVHSIVAAVMAGIGAPDLILPPGASPHGHALRPSEAAAIADADLVVWVGPALTPWLERPLGALGDGAPQLELMAAPGVALLPVRMGASFEPHHHDGDGDEAEEHGAAEGHGAVPAADEGPEVHGEGHGHQPEGPIDAHIWLDPSNAEAIAAAVAAELGRLDPERAAAYAANATAFTARTEVLRDEIASKLAPARGEGYLVFHDAYQYFERAFDLPAAGSIAMTDGEAPSPGRVRQLRNRVLDAGIVCVFSEPQFEPKLVATLVEDTPARTAALDGLGTGLEPGPDLYPAVLRNLAETLADCLEG